MGKKLFVGNLSFETTDAELKELFTAAGTCESASVLMDRATGRSRGFGFVQMSSDDEANRAIAQCNGAELQGRSINVSEARERGERTGFAPRGGPSMPRNFGQDLPAAGGRFKKTVAGWATSSTSRPTISSPANSRVTSWPLSASGVQA